MKKLIAICLAMLMCLSIFAACGTKDPAGTDAPGTTEAPTPQESESTPEESDSTPPASQYDVEAAAEFLDAMYKNENPVTAADYELFGQVMVGLDKYTVAWTVDSDKVTAVEGNPYWTIMVDEMSKETVNYKITGVITAPDGTTATVSYDRTVPEFIVTSFEEYMAATQDQMVTVAGIVVGINAKSVGNTRNHLFLADVDGKGGYYCYQLDKDPLEAGVKLGMTVAVTAPASPYSGMQETKGGDFVIVDETIKDVPVLDITDKFAAGESLKNYVGLVVTIKGVTITDQVLGGTSEYLNFELNGQKAYVRTYVTDFPTTLKAADKAGIDAAHAANFGNSATATGILVLYSGNPYLIPTSTDCFSDYTVVTKSDAEKVEAEIENLTVVENIIEDTTVELVLVGKYYEDVAIAWTIDNEGYTIDENGKLVIALADEQVKLTLTATFTCGEVTETKTFEINVKALAKGVYTGEHVDNPVVGTAYKFYLTAKDGKDYYFNGIKSGNYLQTSTNIADGVDVFVEAVLDGETVTGYRFYFDNAGVKTYIDLTDAGKANLVTENPIAVFNYVAETNCWVAKIGETDYYLGTYNDFNTIGASKTSYINAENTGVSQFPANFAIAVPATYVPNNEKSPVAGTAYKFYLTAKDGKDYYFNGIKSGNYLQTSTNIADGVDVFVEAVLDGETVTGYRFYFDNAGVKTYIDLTDAGKANLVTENPIAVFNYVAETNCWVAKIGETDYYLGTYNDFNTIGASKTSYINAENTGVSQFPANFAIAVPATYVPNNEKSPVAGTAYKFYLTAKDGKDYYFNGIKSGNYLQTSTNIADGVDVFVEAVLDGETVTGYRFYFDNAGVKTYIDLTDAGKANLVTENPIAVFNYVAETNCWVAKIGETDYYLGTYNDFNTIGASKTSYINAENTGVSQFPAVFAILEVITGKDETPTETPDESDTTETPVETPEGAIVVVIANHADANGWQNGTAYPTIDLGSGVTATATGTAVGSYGLNTGKYYENGENWRIYQSESPVVTISVSGGATIVSVKITYDSQNSGVLTLNGTQVESGTVVDVNAATVSFSVGNTGEATNGQARITAIEVVCG